MIETLKFVIGAIVVVAVLWQAVKYLGRFLGWVERSEIARQKAEAAEEAGRKKAAAPAQAAARAPAASQVVGARGRAGRPCGRHRGRGRRLWLPGGPHRGRSDRERLGGGRPLAAPDVASHALTYGVGG